MQLHKISTLLVPCALAAAITTSAHAGTESYSVGFSTVPDIALTQITAMDFGGGLGLNNGDICTMAVSDHTGGNYPGDALMKTATGTVADPTAGDLGGTGCEIGTGAKGTIGIYEISGVAGGTVKVTINDITTGTDFNYTAGGCIGNYNGGGDGDTCLTFTSGAAQSVVLASGGDTVGNSAGAGIPAVGVARIALGGTITATQSHTSGQSLTEQFVIEVTY